MVEKNGMVQRIRKVEKNKKKMKWNGMVKMGGANKCKFTPTNTPHNK